MKFKEKIDELLDVGTKIVITTQVPMEGSNLDIYEVGRTFKQNARILEAYDMTLEAIVTKLMWILADEGQSWEALMFAAQEKIENLVLLIDYNKVQLDGTEDQIMPLEPLKEKLEAFGWLVNDEKYDGNNTSDILKSFQWLDSTPNVPKCVIYDTIKGKGVVFSEGYNTWHGAVIDDEHYEIGIKQLRKDKEEKEARL